MIGLGTRYIDYGLTGGLFIFAGILLFGWLFPEWTLPSFLFFQDLTNDLPPSSSALITGGLTSLFIVGVFATGLILDLIGSLLVVWEADVFRRQIHRNKDWALPLLERYDPFLGDDLSLFLSVPQYSVQEMFSLRVQIKSLSVLLSNRLQTVLLAHLVLKTDASQIEIVTDQLHTCRVARAVFTGITLLVFGTFFASFYVFYNDPLNVGNDRFIVVLALIIFNMVLPTFLVRRAYSRFCASLFSFIFVLEKQAAPAHSTA